MKLWGIALTLVAMASPAAAQNWRAVYPANRDRPDERIMYIDLASIRTTASGREARVAQYYTTPRPTGSHWSEDLFSVDCAGQKLHSIAWQSMASGTVLKTDSKPGPVVPFSANPAIGLVGKAVCQGDTKVLGFGGASIQQVGLKGAARLKALVSARTASNWTRVMIGGHPGERTAYFVNRGLSASAQGGAVMVTISEKAGSADYGIWAIEADCSAGTVSSFVRETFGSGGTTVLLDQKVKTPAGSPLNAVRSFVCTGGGGTGMTGTPATLRANAFRP